MLNILLDDPPLLAVNKPAGLLTQGPPAAKLTLDRLVKDYIRETTGKSGNVYLGIPHRLDRVATGVVVFARNSKAASRLAEVFRDRRVRKTYWAVVDRSPSQPTGKLIDFLRKIPDQAKAEVFSQEEAGTQRAVLAYQVLREMPSACLLEIEIETGRFHQIRAQLAHHGCPIVGDICYGSSRAIDTRDADWIDDGSTTPKTPIALHARRLELPHPIRYDNVVIEAEPPEWWNRQGWI